MDQVESTKLRTGLCEEVDGQYEIERDRPEQKVEEAINAVNTKEVSHADGRQTPKVDHFYVIGGSE